MSAENQQYFKFISNIIRSGLWAELSQGARVLYPVLLSFSDKDFKPVYPGTKTLLKLTGFKQKSSLSRARQELLNKGLITFSIGTGRENTYYQFRAPVGAGQKAPTGASNTASGDSFAAPQYNQIHISIDNNPIKENLYNNDLQHKEKMDFLKRRFGEVNVQLAKSECALGKITPSIPNIEKILYQKKKRKVVQWAKIKRELALKISAVSLDLICRAYLYEKDQLFVFQDILPDHLKTLLEQMCNNIFFEPKREPINRRQQFM